MFERLVHALRRAGVPVSLGEHLALLGALRAGVVPPGTQGFYHLARTALVKDERHFDRFDRAFAEALGGRPADAPIEIPEAWLRWEAARRFTPEERAAIDARGGVDALTEALRRRLAGQDGRHEGGSHWVGTRGTSPLGAGGYAPAGIRLGRGPGRAGRALKVWERREYRNLDDRVGLGTRAFQVALRRLRRWAREGAAEDLDLAETLRATARNGGWLDLRMARRRRNATRVLLLLDAGGSMDAHVRRVERLFSAARSEFERLESYYFHNCLYERVWRDNRRRHVETLPTVQLLKAHDARWRVVFVGDAQMHPIEVTHAGGSVEHDNAEPGAEWLRRAVARWPHLVWLNPVPEAAWPSTASTGLIRALLRGRMYPLTPAGLREAVARL